MAKREPEKIPSLWDPFEELDLLRGFRPLRELGLPGRLSRWLDEGVRPPRFAPAVDISEDDDRYLVTAEIPGATKDDVTVEADEGTLTIRGEKRSEREGKKEQSRWVERSYGSFSRSFTLPANAATERVSASFKDGVLTVEIPKREESKPKVIAIKGA
jgi:HSP20 family protein